MRPPKKSIHAVTTWVRRQPPKVKAFLAVVSGMAALVFLRFIVHDHDNLFVAAEAVHSLGISVLIYKLMKEKSCAVEKAERVRRRGLGAAQVKRREAVRIELWLRTM
ncbi:hypothetical protein Ahy_A10g051344 [Arachis hypogaea]|uniref:Uncharacterized protein n=1 Tax=Arachis hypogaea TaxID=3818 RepID=A0A445BCK9_ARAHY|nr:hypothetical protein Ahy_A10g051344 [Arachis hypogaea]